MRVRYVAALVLLAALALRVGQVQVSSYKPGHDARSYMQLASEIARLGDYSPRDPGAGGTRGPSAYFPPAYPYFLAAVDVLDGHATDTGPAIEPDQLAQVALGTAVVGLIGLVALELFGPRIGLLAAAIAAVYPPLIELSSVLAAETLLAVFGLSAVWAALRARRSATPYRWCALAGLLSGLAALSHENGVVVALPLIVGVAALATPPDRAHVRIVRGPATLLAVMVLTVAPWTIRNAVELHSFIPVSDQTGITLAGTYNVQSANDHRLPYAWRWFATVPADTAIRRDAPDLTEPQLSDRLQDAALDYIGAHPLAPLAVGFDNTRRLLELEGSTAWKVSTASIGLGGTIAEAGVLAFWLACGLALAGAFTASARGTPRWLWAVPILFWLSVVFVNAETPRFRALIDPFLIMLAACALDAIIRRSPWDTRGVAALNRVRRAHPPTPAGQV